MPKDEEDFHKKLRRSDGTYVLDSKFGKLNISFHAIPNYANREGRPDEIELVEISLDFLGERIEMTVPILIELEDSGYYSAKEDLDGYSERSISGRQNSYLKLPFLVIGGARRRRDLKSEDRTVKIKFTPAQIPKDEVQ